MPSGGAGTAFNIDICSGFYFMVAATYREANAPTGTFIHPAQLILPTNKRLPNGSIQQGQCATPPGPDQ